MSRVKSAVLLLFLLLLLGCSDKSIFYSETKTLSKDWKKNAFVSYHFTISDTTKSYNLYLVLRNHNHYPYRNINLFVDMAGRFGTLRKDTLEYDLASPSGEWYGKGLGNLKENLLVYDENLKFPYPGEFSIKIKHAMRKKDLAGVEDISLKLLTNDVE